VVNFSIAPNGLTPLQTWQQVYITQH
jgi:hypothetical protein